VHACRISVKWEKTCRSTLAPLEHPRQRLWIVPTTIVYGGDTMIPRLGSGHSSRKIPRFKGGYRCVHTMTSTASYRRRSEMNLRLSGWFLIRLSGGFLLVGWQTAISYSIRVTFSRNSNATTASEYPLRLKMICGISRCQSSRVLVEHFAENDSMESNSA
jgi:hypothetical protein